MSEIIKVAVDAMGGDNAPGEIVKGAVDAVNLRDDIKVLLVGQEEVLNKELAQYTYNKEQIEVIPTLVVYKGGYDLGSIVAPESKARIDAFLKEALEQ